jgi:hypothetical protein
VELVLEFLLQLALEVVLPALLEMLTDFGWAKSRKRPVEVTDSWFFVVTGLFVAGTLLGGLSLLFWPERVVSRGSIPGLSLVLGPAAVGAIMHLWGRYRTSRGHVTTTLATFAGGAAFALGTAVVRFLGAH